MRKEYMWQRLHLLQVLTSLPTHPSRGPPWGSSIEEDLVFSCVSRSKRNLLDSVHMIRFAFGRRIPWGFCAYIWADEVAMEDSCGDCAWSVAW